MRPFLATFSLSHDVIFLMVSPLLGRFLVSFNLQSAVCGLQSAVCGLSGLQSAVCSLQSAVCSLQMSYTGIEVIVQDTILIKYQFLGAILYMFLDIMYLIV